MNMVWETEVSEEDTWTDHTCVTYFEELVLILEKAIVFLQEQPKGRLDDVSHSVPGTSLRLTLCGNSYASTDFMLSDARSSFQSRVFGIHEPFLLLSNQAFKTEDRNMNQLYLSCLLVALNNTRSSYASIPLVVETNNGHLQLAIHAGFQYEANVSYYHANSDLKLEDVSCMFKTTYPGNVLAKVSARFTWILRFRDQSSLLSGLRICAVFPLSLEGGKWFENELFSTLTLEHAPLWQVSALWDSSRLGMEDGPGAFETEDSSLKMIPITQGFTRLLSFLDFTAVEDDSSRRHQEQGFVQSIARKIRTSSKMEMVADSLAENAFQSTKPNSSPFSRLAMNIVQWMAFVDPNESGNEMIQLVIEASWIRFCLLLRTQFEAKQSLDCSSESLEPHLSAPSVHQKVALIRFCQVQLAQASPQQPEEDGAFKLGRKRALSFTLELDPSQPVFEPVTQAFSVWSSREEEDSELLRHELLSSQLSRDIQAFKFANGDKATFVDFLRWYSPKDVSAQLEVSVRMQHGEWKSCWDSCLPVPVHLQRPGFDPIRVGEKALHFLEILPLRSLLESLVQEVRREMVLVDPSLVHNDCGDDDFLLLEFSKVEAKRSRQEAIRQCSLPPDLKQQLLTNDGSVSEVCAHSDSAAYLLERCRGEVPDKREYLILEAPNRRLYASLAKEGGEFCVARSLAI